MTVWIKGIINLNETLNFVAQDKNVVVLGRLTSEHDVSFNVKNLIIFGGIETTKDISCKTSVDFFNSGAIRGHKLTVLSKRDIYNGLNDQAIEKIRALGIDLIRTPNGGLRVNIPD